jgi:hypothetical protein
VTSKDRVAAWFVAEQAQGYSYEGDKVVPMRPSSMNRQVTGSHTLCARANSCRYHRDKL